MGHVFDVEGVKSLARSGKMSRFLFKNKLEHGKGEDEEVGRMMFSALRKLQRSFNGYCEQIPVLGFNSFKYDLNLVKITSQRSCACTTA